jgi:hypothetical protein
MLRPGHVRRVSVTSLSRGRSIPSQPLLAGEESNLRFWGQNPASCL